MKSVTSKPDKDLDKAHWFSPDLFADSKGLRPAANDLLERLYKHSKPKRKHLAKHLPQLEILILNLIKASEIKNGFMAVSLGSTPYSGEVVSYRVLVRHHLNTLFDMNWLTLHKGYRAFTKPEESEDESDDSIRKSRRSRVEINKPLLKWLEQLSVGAKEIDRSAPKKVLVLKDSNKNVIELNETQKPEAESLSKSTHAINEHLEKTFIDLFLNDYELEELGERMTEKAKENPLQHFHLDLTAKYLKRIFNNSSLRDGGRFYGSWWQSVPSEYRQYISMNGDYVVELDYSSIHIHLLYAQIQQQSFMEDHYVFGKLSEQWRPMTKKMVNILINAGTRTSAVKAANTQQLFSSGLPDGISSVDQYIDEIYFHHDAIRSFFGTGYGVKLQLLDSQIAEAVMLRMLPESCLSVHDSFIVRASQRQRLEQIMNEEFQAATGSEAGIKAKVLELSDARKSVVEELIEDELSSYSTRLRQWRLKHHWEYFTDGGAGTDLPLTI